MVLLFTLKLLSFTQSYVHAHTHTQGLFKQRFINMVPAVSPRRLVVDCDFRNDHLCNALALSDVNEEKVLWV